ncbi:hypothetical protein Clacol_006159 [Clathrus columnatus]|uniref:Uncharacterized protein n=1 Tax=Clathrus columnatus TaxID=1419009 RepID=A0AAV5AG37_9AGAM|nr:hypothetical protein Clacol_006159 [Clathrus columnatus]
MSDSKSLKIPGYEFWIESDGKRAKQFQVQEDQAGNVVSCYIASEAGKEFRIGARKLKDGPSTSVRFYLNDDCVAKRVFKRTRVNDILVSHTYTAKNEKRKFAFSTINFEGILQAEGLAPPPAPDTPSSVETKNRVIDGSKAEELVVIEDSDEEELVVIEDSDEEDLKCAVKSHSLRIKTEKLSSLKRTREPFDAPSGKTKRVRETSDSSIIVIDSD